MLERENGQLYLENTCNSLYLKHAFLEQIILALLSVRWQSNSQLKNKTQKKAAGTRMGNVLAVLSFSIILISNVCFLQHGIIDVAYVKSYMQPPFCLPKSSMMIESCLPHSDLLDCVWENVSPRSNGNHILSLKQTKLLLTLLIHLECIRGKCECEENLLISYSRANEEWKCYLVFSFHFHMPQFWPKCLLLTKSIF